MNRKSIEASRSSITSAFSANIRLPQQHLADGRAARSVYTSPAGTELNGLIDLKSGESRPEGAYLAIEHQNHWFWIDETDLGSKKALSFLNILTQLTATQGGLRGPSITIGAGNGLVSHWRDLQSTGTGDLL